MRTSTHFLIISCSVPLRTRNISGRICIENKTHILCSIIVFFPKMRLNEIIWKNNVGPDRPHCIACWIPKATNTHSDYEILIAFSRQQWLHKRAWMLRYTYVHCLSCVLLISTMLLVHPNSLCIFCLAIWVNEGHSNLVVVCPQCFLSKCIFVINYFCRLC